VPRTGSGAPFPAFLGSGRTRQRTDPRKRLGTSGASDHCAAGLSRPTLSHAALPRGAGAEAPNADCGPVRGLVQARDGLTDVGLLGRNGAGKSTTHGSDDLLDRGRNARRGCDAAAGDLGARPHAPRKASPAWVDVEGARVGWRWELGGRAACGRRGWRLGERRSGSLRAIERGSFQALYCSKTWLGA